ncbi:hypothetical protein [Clostridium autoethanogenum]|uniref:Uncharacterized protein n=1 Tax=Clostridium autoethanogenum DSM 10061 TaxID=1341692 RepID=A0ABN4BKC0_9CLOT|nr:hypothetical protein [Clostridium autoethanogenum]AGY77964.1 hypothetical protein CAETHG_3763 [Clostridium autoethanogenum DSM 10061]ALU38098.1 Hypothetical protein CLAU_3671 [Clostridium autoethanogenum DSM 10061]OVY50862.1 hypothetical protein WX72_02023 [Clostridium autoethanogenum]
MSNVLEIKQQQLQEKIGQIVPWDYVPKENIEHVFTVYISGNMPIKIKSSLTYKQFCKIC